MRGSGISIFVTGLGLTNPGFTDGQTVTANASVIITPQVTIGGTAAAANFAGLVQGFVAGVYRIDAVVPTSITSGAANLVVTAGAGASATVTVVVQ